MGLPGQELHALILDSFCNHAEQLQHQGPFQPLLLRDGQRQPRFVVSAAHADGTGTFGTALSLTASIGPPHILPPLSSSCAALRKCCFAFSCNVEMAVGMVMLQLSIERESRATDADVCFYLHVAVILKQSAFASCSAVSSRWEPIHHPFPAPRTTSGPLTPVQMRDDFSKQDHANKLWPGELFKSCPSSQVS